MPIIVEAKHRALVRGAVYHDEILYGRQLFFDKEIMLLEYQDVLFEYLLSKEPKIELAIKLATGIDKCRKYLD